jgi:membrane protein implicated in regulation of membrane protease activity
MDLANFLSSYVPWAWIVVGLVLLALELLVPGGFLLWLGVAGIVTGLAALALPIGAPVQWVLFGVLGLAAVFLWLRFSRGRIRQSDRPFLNRRAERFIGQEAVLDEAIREGFGRVVLGDTVWRVTGPNLPAGRRVRIVGSEGAVLKVVAV